MKDSGLLLRKTFLYLMVIGIIFAVSKSGETGIAQPSPGAHTDHLFCYPVNESLRLEGTVDVFVPQFGLEPGCRFRKARYFCAPAEKDVIDNAGNVTVREKRGDPVQLMPIPGSILTGDYVCYQVECANITFPEELEVSDQFGMHLFSKPSPEPKENPKRKRVPKREVVSSLLCGPAVKGPAPVCDDGVVDPPEQCDPPGDGCDFNQDGIIDSTCDDQCRCPMPQGVCGDMVLDLGEQCDDGNNNNGDGCRADCTEELCGDGIKDPQEECDDGNDIDDDDCTNGCILPNCGNGEIDPLEQCDDQGESDTCDDDCSAAMCGDRKLNQTAGEQCDDGNNDSGDGCRGDCTIELCGDGIVDSGEQCDDANADNQDSCTDVCLFNICGDGYLLTNRTDAGGPDTEECDDGNIIDGDGCSSSCMLEAFCGDGVIEGIEQCDDGNTNSGDGCSDMCLVEDGWVCETPGGPCRLQSCGDGNVDAGEQCDDGNNTNGDGCSNTCELESVCGNGLVEGIEQCDDGNITSGDGCNSTCQLETVCGDGIIGGIEECDDGNKNDGDGCSANCTLEPLICDPGTADCDGDPGNGCETDISNDVNNCGVCGSMCVNPHGTTSCIAGVCSPTCAAGFDICAGNPSNGCESNLNNDPSNCGVCGHMCSADQECNNGSCQAPPGCNDQTLNGTETDVDCGGSCPPCAAGESCVVDADCQTNFCHGDLCESASCGNGVLDAGEVCDGPNLGGATCAQLGFSGGTLSCDAVCNFDTSGCTN